MLNCQKKKSRVVGLRSLEFRVNIGQKWKMTNFI